MKRGKKYLSSFLGLFAVGCLLTIVSVAIPAATNEQDTLKQYLADLQKNPSDQALREKIIKLVLSMKTKPVVPDEVVKHEGAAEYAFKNAKKESDYADAASEYEKALLLAPWLADDNFNCGRCYENAGKLQDAIRCFNLYLLAAPDAKDATDVKKRIGGLEYAAGKAAQEAQAQDKAKADAEAKQRQTKEVLDQFRTIVGGAGYEALCADYNLEKNKCNGANEEELKGKVWVYMWPVIGTQPADIKYCFDEQSVKIVLNNINCTDPDSRKIQIKGTPNGPNIKDIIFEFTPAEIQEKWYGKGTRQVWAKVNETNGDIQWSVDRPVNSAKYDPTFHYDYTWYKRH